MLVEDQKHFFRARGYSMWPCIKNGDIIKVEYNQDQPFKRGEILLYKAADELHCHRLARIGEGKYWLQRDSFPGEYVPISADDVIGRVVAVGKNGRFFPTNKGIFEFIGIFWLDFGPGLRLFLPWLRKIKTLLHVKN